MLAQRDPWTVAVNEAQRLRVRVVVTGHRLCGLRRGVKLIRHSRRRGGGLVLLVSDDLSVEEATDLSLRALAAISQHAWRAWSEQRRRRA